MSRAEQNDRNRALLFAAARRAFLVRGYHAATLERIADEAGFSKDVVYSRFASKAGLFLALLEDRIAERAVQNAALASELAGSGDFPALLDLAQRAEREAPGWRPLVSEFRIHAARDAGLNRRYATLHARTVEGTARALVLISERGLRVSRRRLGSSPSWCRPSRPAFGVPVIDLFVSTEGLVGHNEPGREARPGRRSGPRPADRQGEAVRAPRGPHTLT